MGTNTTYITAHGEPSDKKRTGVIVDMPCISVPVARDAMNTEMFNAMIARGLDEAKAGKSRMVSDFFADLRREIR